MADEEELKQSMSFVTADGSPITYHIGTKVSDMEPAAVDQARQRGLFDQSQAPAVFGGYVVEENAGAPLPRPGPDVTEPTVHSTEEALAQQQQNPSEPSPHPEGQHPEDTGKDVVGTPAERSAHAPVPPDSGPAVPDEPEDTKKSTSKLGERPGAGYQKSAKSTVGGAKKKKK